jgi:hypothetical protein
MTIIVASKGTPGNKSCDKRHDDDDDDNNGHEMLTQYFL